MIAWLRLLVVAVVLALLARAGRMAWRNRRLSLAVWRRIRPRHVAGSLGLLAVVLATALALLELVPPTRFGLGSLVGFSGNAIFAPVEELTQQGGGDTSLTPSETDTAMPGRPQGWVMLVTGGFLLGLLALLPWLAYVEERAFREGLERASPGRRAWAALRFGLAHLVMLIPVAAALAIAVAGLAYGGLYRRSYRRCERRTRTVADAAGVPVVLRPGVAECRRAAVLETTVWHTTFNSVVVVTVLGALAAQWVLGA